MIGQEEAVAVVAHRTALDTAEATQRRFSFPSPGSVKAGVLADLLDGQHLTHLDVWTRYGSSRAAHHVLRLRQAGFPVETVTIDAPTHDGRTSRIAEYHLPASVIKQVGEDGRRFVKTVRVGRMRGGSQ